RAVPDRRAADVHRAVAVRPLGSPRHRRQRPAVPDPDDVPVRERVRPVRGLRRCHLLGGVPALRGARAGQRGGAAPAGRAGVTVHQATVHQATVHQATVHQTSGHRTTVHRASVRRAPGRRRPGRRASGLVADVALLAVLAASVFPLYWSVVAASGDDAAVARRSPSLLPGGHLLDNVRRVFDTVDFPLALQNSAIVATVVTASNVVLASMAGFAFARLRFRGRNGLFLVVIGSTMVPAQLGVVPLFMLVGALGGYAGLAAVIVPGLLSAFSVFGMRQACLEAVPAELVDAARIDGCSLPRVYWHVAVRRCARTRRC